MTVLRKDIQGWAFNRIYLRQVDFYKLSHTAS